MQFFWNSSSSDIFQAVHGDPVHTEPKSFETLGMITPINVTGRKNIGTSQKAIKEPWEFNHQISPNPFVSIGKGEVESPSFLHIVTYGKEW